MPLSPPCAAVACVEDRPFTTLYEGVTTGLTQFWPCVFPQSHET